MSRLIDVDKLLESLKTEPQYFIQAPRSYKSIMNMISNHHKKVIELIEQQPTIFDVEQLEEFKEYKKNKHRSLRYMYEKGYNKAIDDLTEKAMKKFTELDLKDRCPTVTDCKIILRDTAEELKECAE